MYSMYDYYVICSTRKIPPPPPKYPGTKNWPRGSWDGNFLRACPAKKTLRLDQHETLWTCFSTPRKPASRGRVLVCTRFCSCDNSNTPRMLDRVSRYTAERRLTVRLGGRLIRALPLGLSWKPSLVGEERQPGPPPLDSPDERLSAFFSPTRRCALRCARRHGQRLGCRCPPEPSPAS